MKLDCYSGITDVYHLIFENWEEQIQRQEKIFAKFLPSEGPVLDCSCGIGTQSLAMANLGYEVDGIDLSIPELERARKEANKRGLTINFRQDDMRFLHTAPHNHYGIALSVDNCLPHLDSDEEILMALEEMHKRLKSDGVLLLSVRDYGPLMEKRPAFDPPRFFIDQGYRRTFHQVWDWLDERRYRVHFYITFENEEGWHVHHSVGQYRAISVEEVIELGKRAGFSKAQALYPDETGFYQPMIMLHKG